MVKKMQCFFITCMVLLIVAPISVLGASDLSATKEIQLNVKTEVVGDTMVLPLRNVVESLGGTLQWNEVARTIVVNISGVEYNFRINDAEVQTEVGYVKMVQPVSIINAMAYIPTSALTDVFAYTVQKKGEGYILSPISSLGSAEFSQYSFEELYQIALKNSTAVQKAEVNLKKSDIINEDRIDDYFDSPMPSAIGDSAADMVRLSNLLKLKGAQITKRTAEIAVQSSKDELKYQLRKALYDANNAYSALDVAEKSFGLEKELQEQNKLKYDMGIISSAEYQKGIDNLQIKKEAVSSKKAASDSALEKVDSYLKLGINGYEFLKSVKISYKTALPIDITKHISTILSSSPDIWSLEKAIELSQYNLTYYVYNSSMDPYDATKLDVTATKLTLQNAKELTETSLKQMYQQLIQLEASVATMEKELSKLNQDYRVLKISKDNGLATELSVKQTALAIAALRAQLEEAYSTHKMLKVAFEQPWAAN